MTMNVYVGLSAQMALQKRLDTIANNMANTATAGYRSEQVSFESLTESTGSEPTDFVSARQSHLSLRAGELMQTGNPLDIAVRGDSWLAIETPSGTAYTRDGRFQMSTNGELETVVGDRLLDVGGSPIQLDPNGGAPQIAKDGTVTQAGRRLGAIGLFKIDSTAFFERTPGGGVVPSLPAIPDLDFNSSGIIQGYIERSNVNPVIEMTKLVAVQRSFEAVSNTLHEVENSMQDAIRSLGGNS